MNHNIGHSPADRAAQALHRDPRSHFSASAFPGLIAPQRGTSPTMNNNNQESPADRVVQAQRELSEWMQSLADEHLALTARETSLSDREKAIADREVSNQILVEAIEKEQSSLARTRAKDTAERTQVRGMLNNIDILHTRLWSLAGRDGEPEVTPEETFYDHFKTLLVDIGGMIQERNDEIDCLRQLHAQSTSARQYPQGEYRPENTGAGPSTATGGRPSYIPSHTQLGDDDDPALGENRADVEMEIEGQHDSSESGHSMDIDNDNGEQPVSAPKPFRLTVGQLLDADYVVDGFPISLLKEIRKQAGGKIRYVKFLRRQPDPMAPQYCARSFVGPKRPPNWEHGLQWACHWCPTRCPCVIVPSKGQVAILPKFVEDGSWSPGSTEACWR